jgi:hypothetical protein
MDQTSGVFELSAAEFTRRQLLFAFLAALTAIPPRAAAARGLKTMDEEKTPDHDPQASKAIDGFAFLIGDWRFEARFKSETGKTNIFHGAWIGRRILDGHVIADEYRMFGPGGEVSVLGMNFRVYDSVKQLWAVKWLNALNGTWLDLTSEEFGGAKFQGNSVSYIFREPAGTTEGWSKSITRATYTSAPPDIFYWRGEKSEDQLTWQEFMVVECQRVA